MDKLFITRRCGEIHRLELRFPPPPAPGQESELRSDPVEPKLLEPPLRFEPWGRRDTPPPTAG